MEIIFVGDFLHERLLYFSNKAVILEIFYHKIFMASGYVKFEPFFPLLISKMYIKNHPKQI